MNSDMCVCGEEPVVNEHVNKDTWHAMDEYCGIYWVQFYDDMSGAPLITKLVVKAIEEEITV